MFQATDSWNHTFPGACAGFLAMDGVENPAVHPELESLKRSLEEDLRARFAGQERGALEGFGPIPAYNAYYRKFEKTYHVQAQVASIAFKGKPIPSAAALVEAMFMAEVKNALLTAGHDLDCLGLPVIVDAAQGSEEYLLMRGAPQTLKAGDMFMADRQGVISSILYGPDQRTRLNPATHRALFAVYAPAGVGAAAVRAHLEDIRAFVQVVAPQAGTLALDVLGAA